MLAEGKLAIQNTANLMHERGLIETRDILNALSSGKGTNEIVFDSLWREETLLDQKVEIECKELEKIYPQVKNIVKKIKEEK